MELKPMYRCGLILPALLLIVPYGIETKQGKIFLCMLVILLIVPYGIETYGSSIELDTDVRLLIVPYGIETYLRVEVLNGIEPFNRTLWN